MHTPSCMVGNHPNFGSKTMKVKNYYDKRIAQNEPNTWTFLVLTMESPTARWIHFIWQRKICFNFEISCKRLPLHATWHCPSNIYVPCMSVSGVIHYGCTKTLICRSLCKLNESSTESANSQTVGSTTDMHGTEPDFTGSLLDA